MKDEEKAERVVRGDARAETQLAAGKSSLFEFNRLPETG